LGRERIGYVLNQNFLINDLASIVPVADYLGQMVRSDKRQVLLIDDQKAFDRWDRRRRIAQLRRENARLQRAADRIREEIERLSSVRTRLH
jgi:hypothetical protein